MKRYNFSSFEEFENSGLLCNEEEVVAITENGWFKADLMTECKRWKTAVNRFFKACPELIHWKKEVVESIESGYWKCSDSMLCNGERNPNYSFCWALEENSEGLWYIYCNEKMSRW